MERKILAVSKKEEKRKKRRKRMARVGGMREACTRGRCEACYGESRLAWTRTSRERVFPLDRGIVIHDATVRRLIR